MIRLLFLTSLSVALTGCTLLISTERARHEDDGGGDDHAGDPDARGADDGDPADAAPVEGDAPDVGVTNLALNPSCEEGTTGWKSFNGSLTQTAIARTGFWSCRVCKLDAAHPHSTLDDEPERADGPVGRVYEARAWVRNLAGPARDARIHLRQVREGGSESNQGNEVTLTDEWQEVVVTRELAAPIGTSFDSYVSQDGDVGNCFLIDDLSLRLVSDP